MLSSTKLCIRTFLLQEYKEVYNSNANFLQKISGIVNAKLTDIFSPPIGLQNIHLVSYALSFALLEILPMHSFHMYSFARIFNIWNFFLKIV